MGVNLYVNLDTLQLIEGPGFRNPITALRFKRGDAAKLEVTFLHGGTSPASIGNSDTLELHFGIKPRNRYDAGYLVHTADWTLPNPDATTPVYQCSPSFNTLELDAEFGIGSSTGTELAEITLMGEITWREGAGAPTSTRTLLVVVENDVNRGTEGVPLSADPAYPAPANIITISTLGNHAVRFDMAQSLSDAQKAQARANIGAGTGGGGGTVTIGDITGLADELATRPYCNFGDNPGTIDGADVGHNQFLIDGQRVWLYHGYDYSSREFLTINQTAPVAGSIPVTTSSGDATLLMAGAEGQVLTIVEGVPAWADPVPTSEWTDVVNPLTRSGGMIDPSSFNIPAFDAHTEALEVRVTFLQDTQEQYFGLGFYDMYLDCAILSQTVADYAMGTLAVYVSTNYPVSTYVPDRFTYHFRTGDVFTCRYQVSSGGLGMFMTGQAFNYMNPVSPYLSEDGQYKIEARVVARV